MNKEQIINEIAKHYHLTRNVDVAEFFGISQQSSVAWMKGGYNIYEVYKRCPDINPYWLLSMGEDGEMLRPSEEEDNETLTTRGLLENLRMAQERLAEEQNISRRVLEQCERVLRFMEDKKEP